MIYSKAVLRGSLCCFDVIDGEVEVSNFQIRLNLHYLSNISTMSAIAMKNNVFTISVAILFSGK